MTRFLRKILFLFLLTATFSVSAFATSTEFREEDWDPVILMMFQPEQRQDVEKTLISPPPEVGSEKAKKELEHLRVLVKSRTDEQEKRFKEIEKDPFLHLFNTVGLLEDEFIQTRLLIYSTLHTLNKKLYEEKWRYQRLRPTQIDVEIDSLKPLPGSSSYPAERAAQARVVAHVLTDIMPEYERVWQGWANDVGKLYEVAGLQFRSDTEAGQELADDYYSIFKQDLNFQNSVLNAEIELINFEPNIRALNKKFDVTKLPKSFP